MEKFTKVFFMNIALVAHDGRKAELLDWCRFNRKELSKHNLLATGTTAKILSKIVLEIRPGAVSPLDLEKLQVRELLSGPLGGDQQIGAMIAEGKIDCLIFFCDNLITQGHQQDVSALSRLASLYNISFATNRTTADMILTSPLFGSEGYRRVVPSCIEHYKNRIPM